MSNTERHRGTATLIPKPQNTTLEDHFRWVLKNHINIELANEYPEYYDDIYEYAFEEHKISYKVLVNQKQEKIYLLDNKDVSYEALSASYETAPNTFNYFLLFYNGGTWFGEALEKALESPMNTK